MHQNKFLASGGAIVTALSMSGAALAASSPGLAGSSRGPASSSAVPVVTVQVKSLTKTLLKPTKVRGEKGSITKGGTPKGKCPGDSAAGALDAATHHRWAGKYYSSVPGIFVTSILGVKPKSPDYWSIFLNGKSSSEGICAIKLRAGEKLLFKIIK